MQEADGSCSCLEDIQRANGQESEYLDTAKNDVLCTWGGLCFSRTGKSTSRGWPRLACGIVTVGIIAETVTAWD